MNFLYVEKRLYRKGKGTETIKNQIKGKDENPPGKTWRRKERVQRRGCEVSRFFQVCPSNLLLEQTVTKCCL